MRKNLSLTKTAKVVVLLFLSVTVLVPMAVMLVSIDSATMRQLLSSPQFTSAFFNSLTTTITATIISILIAFILALAINRSNIKHKGILIVILTLPMLIPSISHGMGLIVLFGANGIITRLFNLSFTIYGFWGIVIGSIMYSFPLAFIMISDILKYEDFTPYEAADVLGFSSWHKFKAVFWPYLRKPLISVFFAVFTLVLTDYGVPLILGGRINTLPVLMYEEVIGLLNFNKGAIIGSILLIPAIIAFIVDFLNKDRGSSAFITSEFSFKENKLRDFLAYLFVFIIIGLLLLPIISFLIITFTSKYPSDISFSLRHIRQTMTMGGSKYLFNSILISSLVAIIGTFIAYITAYITSRLPSNLSKTIHLISITTLAIPGLVLGLSYVITFKKTPIYATLAILVLVNIVHFFASPYLMIYNTFNKLNENLEDVGKTLGISRLKMIKDVFVPLSQDTIFEMLSYLFVNSMITISAISFLANTQNKPLSLLISQFEGNMMLEASAFISLLILVINLIMKMTIHLIKNRKKEKGVTYDH